MHKVKDPLCETLLKNCICQERLIFSLSFRTFSILMWNYKEFIKPEISLFIEQIFMKILISENSSFSHRFSSLQILTKICSSPKMLLEFFVNYDCDIGYFNVVEKIVEMLGKISQGKYLKTEYSLVIQPEKETQLRNMALDGLVFMINILDKFLEDSENMLSGIKEVKEEGKNNDLTQSSDIDQISNFSDISESLSVIDPEKFIFRFY